MSFTLYVIHTTHTDIGYTDTQEAVKAHHIAYIREALDLAPIPADVALPDQGPTRPSASGSRARSNRESGGRGGGGGGMGAGGGGGGLGVILTDQDSSQDR